MNHATENFAPAPNRLTDQDERKLSLGDKAAALVIIDCCNLTPFSAPSMGIFGSRLGSLLSLLVTALITHTPRNLAPIAA